MPKTSNRKTQGIQRLEHSAREKNHRSSLIVPHTAPAQWKCQNVLLLQKRVRLLRPKETSNLPPTPIGGRLKLHYSQRGKKANAILSDPLQLHTRNVGEAHQKSGGPPSCSSTVHRIGRRKVARFLVCLRRSRRVQLVGST